MNKSAKSCFLASFLILIFLSCAGAALFTGISIGKTQNRGDTTTQVGEITEKTIYYPQENAQRYFDENTPTDVYQKLIQDSTQHFVFEYKVADSSQFKKDKSFILANLENQYSRLAVKFNIEISQKITVRVVDDLEVFQEDLDTILIGSGVTTYSAFSLGTELIEVYISPPYAIEKFDLARTLSHELVHIFQLQINGQISAYSVPWASASWFLEGMAEGFAYPNEEALVHKEAYQIIPNTSALNDMINSRDSAEYMIGYDVVELFFLYLSETYGEDKMIQLLKCQSNFDQCFAQTTGKSPDTAYSEWLETL